MTNNTCIRCNCDISHRSVQAKHCEPCYRDVRREKDRIRVADRSEKRRLARIAAKAQKPASTGFMPVSKTPLKPDNARLQASRVKGGKRAAGLTPGQLARIASDKAARERSQAELLDQRRREENLRVQSALIPERLRAMGYKVRVQISEAQLKHLDKQSRRIVERMAKPGLAVLPEPHCYPPRRN